MEERDSEIAEAHADLTVINDLAALIDSLGHGATIVAVRSGYPWQRMSSVDISPKASLHLQDGDLGTHWNGMFRHLPPRS